MDLSIVEPIEIDLLLEAVFKRYGYDFRSYARASVERRIRLYAQQTDCASIADMIPRVLHENAFFEGLVRTFSITVTEMFRDPEVYRCLRERVTPFLETYPYFKVWHAGCATGEEVYSLGILLQEAGLYDRATVYATDFNDDALDVAKHGLFSLDGVKTFTKNYQDSGGTSSFADYYHARYDAIAIDGSLRKNMTFANHNLVTDGVFSEVQLLLCRNVLIYFNKTLQERALKLFYDSLAPGGFLCLGNKETLDSTAVRGGFEDFDAKHRIFRKKMED